MILISVSESMDYQIQFTESGSKGSFIYVANGKKGGEMTFSKAGEGMIIIDHTEVEDDFRGKGVGLAPVEHAIEFVKERKIKMFPLCPFTKATLQRHSEWADVW